MQVIFIFISDLPFIKPADLFNYCKTQARLNQMTCWFCKTCQRTSRLVQLAVLPLFEISKET